MLPLPRTVVLAAAALAALAVLPTAAQAAPAPPAPIELHATNSSSSISLTWTQPNSGRRAASFRVYEGGAIVARNTTTRATVLQLGFGTTHTFTVRAVDAAGNESAPSEPVTRQV